MPHCLERSALQDNVVTRRGVRFRGYGAGFRVQSAGSRFQGTGSRVNAEPRGTRLKTWREKGSSAPSCQTVGDAGSTDTATGNTFEPELDHFP